MKIAIGIGTPNSGRKKDWDKTVGFVVESEKLGVDCCWSAEAWGQGTVVPLAFLAAKITKIRLGTGIMQISARTPSMTALTMASVSDNRFMLGLGASGPQVVEDLQDRPFKAQMTRMSETIEIVRLAFAGEKLAYEGKYHQLPVPAGEGKALRLSQPANQNIPIYLATLGSTARDLTGEMADDWIGTSYKPDHGKPVIDAIENGARKAGKSIAEIDLQVGGSVEFGDILEQLIGPKKMSLAFQLGAMGSAGYNFYNDAFKRQGFAEDAIAVQQLWLAGKRAEAAKRVPNDMVAQCNLLGTEEMVKERIVAFKAASITTLRLVPEGKTFADKLEWLGRAIDLVRAVGLEASQDSTRVERRISL